MRLLAALVFGLSFVGNAHAWTHGAVVGGSAPTLSSINPTSGGTAGGTTVTLTGSGLGSVTAVTFGGTNASSFTCTASSCTAVSPAGSSTESVVAVNSFGSSGGQNFLYQDFTQSYTAGTTDPNSNTLSGTETRGMFFTTVANGNPLPTGSNCSASATMARCPVLMAFNGFWEDNNCNVGQGPQALALSSSLGNWYLDNTFAATSPCGGSSFNVVNAQYDYWPTYDGAGNQVTGVDIPVISGSTNPSIYARNNVLGTWSNFTWAGGTNVNRAISDHEDDSTSAANNHVDYLLIGNDTDGIHQATWLASPWGYTISTTSENFCQNWTSGTTCNTPCSPNTIVNCTQVQGFWPDLIPATSGSSDGAHMTINWASANALQAPLSPNVSRVALRNLTGGAACTALNTGTQLVTAQTSTSVTIATAATSCGYGSVTVGTPANIVVNWSGAITPPTGTVTVSGITGYSGDNPNGTQTINFSTGTLLQFSSNTDCHTTCTGGTVSGTGYNKTLTGWDSDVPTIAIPNVRVIGITDCPVTSGGNSAGVASFSVTQMNVWRQVDKGANSFLRLVGALPYQSSTNGAGFPSGQPQLRGLTCVVDSTKSGGYALLAHVEGDGQTYSMDPNTGIFNVESNLITAIRAQWPGSTSYGIDAYNSASIYPYTLPNGNSYYMFSEGNAFGAPSAQPFMWIESPQFKGMSYSGFWARSVHAPASPSAPSYTVFPTSGSTTAAAKQAAAILNVMAQTVPAGSSSGNAAGGYGTLGFNACSTNCPVMMSTRAGPLVSLFPEDGGNISAVSSGSGTSTLTLNFSSLNITPVQGFTVVGLTSSGTIGNANGQYICGVGSTTCTSSSVTITPSVAPTGTVTFTNAIIEWQTAQTLFFGGYDANITAVHNTAWIGRAPASMFAWP